ncbi:glutathione S-transferase family protein [Parvibaculum sp.]|uniref:glutathione S-transferase family protein n=1 Tax=Parvibaculum sp. TaxID=2024848 RepID=UPI000C8C78C8|nr:glutathione S-transferase family protein [Parvibaculum sp.]MAB14579.1 glutathione S-transferase [Parvibaculum sp.]
MAKADANKADATSIILHQYDVSPFSEKVRVALGIKGLDWFACDEPVIMPKPELTSLTGGYRKIPVMQIGADIYCDTQIILRELEKRYPAPTLFPGEDKGLGWGLSMWTDRILFQTAVAVIFGGAGDAVDEAFKKDREALTGRPFDTDAMKAAVPLMTEQLRAQLGWIEEQLADGRDFLMGDKPGLADASGFYNLAFMRWIHPQGAAMVEHMPKLAAWEERVKAIGHGNRQEISRDDALAIAKASTSVEKEAADPNEPNGWKPGDLVSVTPDDYGRDPVVGVVVSSSAQHIAIHREDMPVGDVVVHFPRAGFFVMPA